MCKKKECVVALLQKNNRTKFPFNFLTFVYAKNASSEFLDAHVDDLFDKNKIFGEYFQTISKVESKRIIFHGEVGVGKTYALWACFKEACADHPSWFPRIYTEQEIFRLLKEEIDGGKSAISSNFFHSILECRALFLDDLGSTTKSLSGDWGKDVMFDLIDARSRNDCMTVITTNLQKDDPQLLGERSTDRLNLWLWISTNQKKSNRRYKN